jgi:hypothetical protein
LKPEESLSARPIVISPVLNLRATSNWPIASGMQSVGVTLRVRWIVITGLFLFTVAAIYQLCHIAGAIGNVVGVARRITLGALFAVGFWSASIVLQKWMGRSIRPLMPAGQPAAPPPPVPTFEISEPDGPPRYRVRGVDRETHFEIEEFVFAESPSNAQLKVELKGVDVAVVERA